MELLKRMLITLSLAVCGGSLSGVNGSFNYRSPDVGPVRDVTCFWVIRTEEGKVLRITFTFFQLESVNNCPHEFLQIHDGDSSAAFQLGRFCGSRLPHELLSSDNALYFHFYSEYLRNERGFTIRWETQQPVSRIPWKLPPRKRLCLEHYNQSWPPDNIYFWDLASGAP